MTYETERFKQIYDTIRQKFRDLPACEVTLTTQDLGGAAFYQGRTSTGAARFLLNNTALYEHTVWHEACHALVDARGQARLKEFWSARGFPGTWEEQMDLHLRLSQLAAQGDRVAASKVWASNPSEMLCEAFAATYVDGYSERTERFGVPLDRAKMRAFYEMTPVVAPVAPPAVADNTPDSRTLDSHWYSQFGADSVSQGDCVPACIKMMLSLYQREVPTIGSIRGILGVPSGGVDLVTMRSALDDLGIQGVVVSSRDVPFDDVLSHVREGRPTILFVLYADIPNRVDPFGGLHAVVLVSVEGTRGIVLDPDNARDIPAYYALDDLRNGWNNSRTIGGGAFIPDEEVGGDMDRAAFNAWFLEEYAKVGAAAKFDELATQIGKNAKHKHAACYDTSEPIEP